MAEKYTKAICDNDFDGVICAAMLKAVYPELELIFTEPTNIRSCKYDFKVDENTIVADLPFIAGCGLYFDHHASNEPAGDFNGIWKASDSAAGIIRDYYKEKIDLARFDPIIADLSRFDSGQFTLEDLNNPSEYMQIGFTIDRFYDGFGKYFAEKLAVTEWSEVWQEERVQNKVTLLKDRLKRNSEFIRAKVELISNLAFLNSGDNSLPSLHPIFVSQEFPETLGVVMFKNKARCVKVTMFRNNFIADTAKYDFLAIAKAINPAESGGHKSGCGFDMPENLSVKDCTEKILTEFSKQL